MEIVTEQRLLQIFNKEGKILNECKIDHNI
jgi:hypothetical protein